MRNITELINYYAPKLYIAGRTSPYSDVEDLNTEYMSNVEELSDVEDEIVSYFSSCLSTDEWKNEQLWIWAAITHPSEKYVDYLLKMIKTNSGNIPHWRSLDALTCMPESSTSKIVRGIKEAIELNNPSWSQEDLKKSFEALIWIQGEYEEKQYIEKMCNSPIPRIAEMARYWDEWLMEE